MSGNNGWKAGKGEIERRGLGRGMIMALRYNFFSKSRVL